MSEFKIRRLATTGEILPSYGPRFAGVHVDKTTGELWVNADGTHRKVIAPDYQAVVAAGSNQGNATAITYASGSLVDVTEADGTKGVKLPAIAAGVAQVFYIYNNSASNLKVYPATGDDINDGSANAAVTVASKVLAVFTSLDAASWAAVYTAGGTYATLTGTETLTNKTLTTPKLGDGDAGLTLTSADQTHGSATVTFPDIGDAADEVVLKDTSVTMTNKTLTSPVIAEINSDLSVVGTVISADATTPYFETASGKTNGGYVNIKGKTSGALKLIAADAAAQTVTVSLAAQTSGAATVSIEDRAGVNARLKVSPEPMVAAGGTETVATITHSDRITLLDTATGTTVTLPAATGSGNRYEFIVSVMPTSNQHRFTVTGNDTFKGSVTIVDQDNTTVIACPALTNNQINLDGDGKGGQVGDWIELVDVATDVWAIRGSLQAKAGGSAPGTPFATV